jgi:hypothetical protein
VGDALGGRVGAVGGAEGVVDVDVAERGEPLGQLGSFFVSPGSKRLFSSSRTSPGPSARGHASTSRRRPPGQLHLGAEQLAEPLGHRRHRELRVAAARPAEVRDEDDAAPRSRSSSIVGSAARIRVSSATRRRRAAR